MPSLRQLSSSRLTAPLIAAIVALIVRSIFLVSLAHSPLFAPVEGGHDRTLYHLAAQGPLIPDGAFEYLPLYPLALHAVYAVSGPALVAAAIFGILCDALTTLLIVLIALRLGARPLIALIAALCYALYPLAIVYSCITMPNTLNAFLAALIGLALLHIPRERGSLWFGLGLLTGLAALGWAAWLMIVAVLLAYWLIARPQSGPTLRNAALFAFAFAIPLIPVAAHNSRAEGSFILLTTHGGFNFYMGNHERATGYPLRVQNFRMTARAMLEDAHHFAEQATDHTLTRAESSAWWSGQAREFWRTHPVQALSLFARKCLYIWNQRDVDDLRMVEQAKLLIPHFGRHAGFGFFIISVLGLFGLFRAPRATALRIVILTGAFSIALYFITARYRLTLAPLLLGIGAGGIQTALATRSSRRALILNIALLIFAATVAAWPIPLRDVRAVDYYNASVQLLKAYKTEDAIATARAGLEIEPLNANLHHALGSGLYMQSAYSEAAAEFERCATLDPSHPQALYNWGLCLARSGDYCGARDVLQRAAALRPPTEQARALAQEVTALCAETAH